MSLVCYLGNIRIIYVVDENILPNIFDWQENDLVFSSEFEKKHYKKQQHINIPIPYTHTTQIKIQHVKVSISGPQGKGTQILCDSKIDVCLYSFRHTCVFKIHVRTYSKQSIWTDQIHLQ